jgi:hypothetical protein
MKRCNRKAILVPTATHDLPDESKMQRQGSEDVREHGGTAFSIALIKRKEPQRIWSNVLSNVCSFSFALQQRQELKQRGRRNIVL